MPFTPAGKAKKPALKRDSHSDLRDTLDLMYNVSACEITS
jgi:hypothetical protein